jgi:Leukotriene A4 hydrolase, C-terminal
VSSVAVDFANQALKWVTGRDGTGVIKGRMKFCRPIFRAASRVNAGLAKESFAQSKEEFHPIARKLIEKVRGSAKSLQTSVSDSSERILCLCRVMRLETDCELCIG